MILQAQPIFSAFDSISKISDKPRVVFPTPGWQKTRYGTISRFI